MPVEIQKDNSLLISGFQDGIGVGTLGSFSDMLGVNIDSNPGVASVNLKFNKVQETIAPKTFTSTHGVDLITPSSTLWYRGSVRGLAVTLSTTGTLPAPLAADTIYYVVPVGTSTVNYKLAETLKLAMAGTTINITDDGSGTHTITPITPGAIKDGCWTVNPQGRIFALDSNQRLWFAGTDGVIAQWYLLTGNTSSGTGNGLVYYKGYHIVWGTGKTDALTDINNVTSEDITWTNDFADITIENSGSAYPYLSTNDDSIYFYNGDETGQYYKIGLLEEVAGQTFDPTNDATFDFVADAVTIPYEDDGYVTDINEINQKLVIGTYSNKLYIWDKKSPSFTSLLKLPEKRIVNIQTADNYGYIFIENSPNVYITDTSTSALLFRIPDSISGNYYGYIYGVDTMKVVSANIYKRELLFSVTMNLGGTSPAETAKVYLFSYNFDSKKLTKKNVSAYGESQERSASDYGKIHSIFNDANNILLSTSSYDISDAAYSYAVESLQYVADVTSGSPANYTYASYEPYIITGLIPVGQPLDKRSFREVSISLLRNLATGQGVRVSYRLDDSSSWTVLKTIDYATDGAIKDIRTPAPITNIVDLQIKIEMSGYNQTSPRLKYVRLIP